MTEPDDAKVALSDLIRLLTNSRIVDTNRFIAHGRELAADLNLPCIPVGAGNSKTGVPGTYRPVGPSCPSCPLDAGCYARFGPVGLHQARASTDALAGATAAVIAIIAALRMGTAARLHVSGDFSGESMKIQRAALVLALAGLTGCATTLTNWLMTDPTGARSSTKCVVEEGKTTKAQFEKTCGKAFRLQSSRGCDSYTRDDGKILYFCWKKGKLDKVLTTKEWLQKRGE